MVIFGSRGRKIVAIIIVTLVLFPVAYWAAQKFLVTTQLTLLLRAPTDKKFMDAWAEDVRRLGRAHVLPAGFQDLRKVSLNSPSNHLLKIYEKYPPPFGTKPRGHYDLEIFMDEIDGGGVVIQYDLVDVKSGNTIWELGRTFPHHLEDKK